MPASSNTDPTPPAHSAELLVSFPAPNVLLLTLNRPKALNAMTPTLEADLYNVLRWFDDEPSLWYVCVCFGSVRIQGDRDTRYTIYDCW